MLTVNSINVSDYTPDLIKKAIAFYYNNREASKTRYTKYYSTDAGRERALHRAKVYYWKVKKNNKYHKIYNPEGEK